MDDMTHNNDAKTFNDSTSNNNMTSNIDLTSNIGFTSNNNMTSNNDLTNYIDSTSPNDTTLSNDDFELLNSDVDRKSDDHNLLQRSSGNKIESETREEILSASFFPRPKKNNSVRRMKNNFLLINLSVLLVLLVHFMSVQSHFVGHS
jgi:hypothetical protein